MFIRHVAGLMIEDDGSVVIDPLPLGLDHFSLEGAPYRGRSIDVSWVKPKQPRERTDRTIGLTVRVNGKIVLHRPNFAPGDKAVPVTFE